MIIVFLMTFCLFILYLCLACWMFVGEGYILLFLLTRIMNWSCRSVCLDLVGRYRPCDTKDPGSLRREEHELFSRSNVKEKKTL
jgi:hypothetical protein